EERRGDGTRGTVVGRVRCGTGRLRRSRRRAGQFGSGASRRVLGERLGCRDTGCTLVLCWSCHPCRHWEMKAGKEVSRRGHQTRAALQRGRGRGSTGSRGGVCG
ncbi:hypothetical protein BCR44DRAFT_1435816, partial [Catenaria anguillulae PL171]